MVKEFKYSVSTANMEDVPELAALAYKSYGEIGGNLPEPSTEAILTFFSSLIKDEIILIVREQNKRIVGVLALTTFNLWWSEESVLNSAFFYIIPEFRKDNIARLLLESAKEYSNLNNVKLFIDIFTDLDLDKKEIFLKREGFTKIGSIFSFSKE